MTKDRDLDGSKKRQRSLPAKLKEEGIDTSPAFQAMKKFKVNVSELVEKRPRGRPPLGDKFKFPKKKKTTKKSSILKKREKKAELSGQQQAPQFNAPFLCAENSFASVKAFRVHFKISKCKVLVRYN